MGERLGRFKCRLPHNRALIDPTFRSVVWFSFGSQFCGVRDGLITLETFRSVWGFSFWSFMMRDGLITLYIYIGLFFFFFFSLICFCACVCASLCVWMLKQEQK
jgi:hypothetical protein